MTTAAVGHPRVSTPASLLRHARALSALPTGAWAYWLAVVAPGAAAAGFALTHTNGGDFRRFAALTAAASLAQLSSVRLKGRRVFHPAIVFVVAGALLLTPGQLVLMCVTQHLLDQVKQRYAWYVQPFNVANYVLAALSAWVVLHAVAGHGAPLAAAGAATALTFVLVNRTLLVPMITLSRGLSIRETRLAAIDDVSLELVLALMAIPLVALWSRSISLAALSLAPLVLIHFTQRATNRLQDASETISEQNESLEEAKQLVMQRSMAALEALSATVDARDPSTAGHSRRVREYAVAIGRELGLSNDELEPLRQAALLHDIGKIGVPDSVLQKQGSLTSVEWLVMKSHPEEGARIIERLGYLDEVVPTIRHHHERPDGTGYPAGLAGEAIPLAARIIHVADALDAMTSKRVYRDAMPLTIALAELRYGAGTDFCAETVAATTRAVEAGAISMKRARLHEVTAA